MKACKTKPKIDMSATVLDVVANANESTMLAGIGK
jgi:hypothetical protein